MTSFLRVRLHLLTGALLLATATVARHAAAGTVQIRDEARVLSADDAARLRSAVASAPFDARVVFTNAFPDAQELSRDVGSLVTEPNLVAVGVDPQHHHVQVHFGTGSHVPRSEYSTIEHAGNDAFRRADWEGGAEAILREASQSVTAGGAVDRAPVQDGTSAATARPSLFGPGVLLLLVAGIIGLAVYFARRRPPYGSFGGPGYGGGPGSGQGYPGQGYPMVPPQGGMGPIGGGLIGAGLGGLAGYELGKMQGEHEREDRPLEGGDRGDPGGNFDAGGGGSSWDDDGGGSGGDGGGFDSGGDGGGGGSDF